MVMGIGSCSERRGRTGRAVLVRDAFKKCLACVFRLGGDDGQSNRRLTQRSKEQKKRARDYRTDWADLYKVCGSEQVVTFNQVRKTRLAMRCSGKTPRASPV